MIGDGGSGKSAFLIYLFNEIIHSPYINLFKCAHIKLSILSNEKLIKKYLLKNK